MLGIKNGVLVSFGVLGLVGGFIFWYSLDRTPVAQVSTPSPYPGIPVDWTAVRAAHEKALRDNPDLAAEYKSLVEETEKQNEEMNAALIKADPEVAPILTKIAALQTPPSPAQNP